MVIENDEARWTTPFENEELQYFKLQIIAFIIHMCLCHYKLINLNTDKVAKKLIQFQITMSKYFPLFVKTTQSTPKENERFILGANSFLKE